MAERRCVLSPRRVFFDAERCRSVHAHLGRVAHCSLQDQVSCGLGDEAAIVNLKNGVYYGLDSVGARIWSAIRQPITFGQIRDALVAEYDVEPRALESDIRDFLAAALRTGTDRDRRVRTPGRSWLRPRHLALLVRALSHRGAGPDRALAAPVVRVSGDGRRSPSHTLPVQCRPPRARRATGEPLYRAPPASRRRWRSTICCRATAMLQRC